MAHKDVGAAAPDAPDAAAPAAAAAAEEEEEEEGAGLLGQGKDTKKSLHFLPPTSKKTSDPYSYHASVPPVNNKSHEEKKAVEKLTFLPNRSRVTTTRAPAATAAQTDCLMSEPFAMAQEDSLLTEALSSATRGQETLPGAVAVAGTRAVSNNINIEHFDDRQERENFTTEVNDSSNGDALEEGLVRARPVQEESRRDVIMEADFVDAEQEAQIALAKQKAGSDFSATPF